MGQLGSHWTDFHEIRCMSIFVKSIQKLYAFFWVLPRRLNFVCRRFATLFRNVGIQNSDAGELIHKNTAKVLNQEINPEN